MARNSPRARPFQHVEASIAPSGPPRLPECAARHEQDDLASASVISIIPAFSGLKLATVFRASPPGPQIQRHQALGFQHVRNVTGTILCASPSTMAVLPTPGSPIIQDCSFVRRARICITRESLVPPMTGSSLSGREIGEDRARTSQASYVASGILRGHPLPCRAHW